MIVLYVDSSSSEEEEAPVFTPRLPKRQQLSLTWESCSGGLNNKEFQQAYRLTRAEFEGLCQKIRLRRREAGPRQYTGGIQLRLALGATLRFLAGGQWSDIARLHGMRKAAFYKHIWRTLPAIVAVLPGNVDWSDPEVIRRLKEQCRDCGCRRTRAFDNCVGYIDGVIIGTERPVAGTVRNVRDYWCDRKKMYGVNVQVICDAHLRITHMSCKHGGATHDSTAIKHTSFGNFLLDGGLERHGVFLVGDAAYRRVRSILTPFSRVERLGSPKDNFNYVLSSKRCSAERVLGAMVRRWGILWRSLRFTFRKNCLVLEAVRRLHNVCRERPVSKYHARDIGFQPVSNELVTRALCDMSNGPDPENRGGLTAEQQLRTEIMDRLGCEGIRRPALRPSTN